MIIYEFQEEDYNKTLEIAEDIKELATHLVKCLNKGKEREAENRLSNMNFRRRAPRMRGGSGYGYEPHMRGYLVRPEDEDPMYNERYAW